MTFLTAAILVLCICVYSVLFTGAGYVLWRKIGLLLGSNPSFTLAASFFLGTSGFQAIWALLQTIFGIKVALILLTVCLVAICVPVFSTEINWNRHKRYLIIISAGSCLFALLNLAHALSPLPRIVLDPTTAPYSYGFGAVNHSFRAENLSNAIVAADSLPLINQNSGQALLAAIPHVLGINMPQLSLIVWHSIVLIFSSLFVWGLARIWLKPRAALFPTSLVLLGNTAVSYRYISVTDSSHAILLSHNYEVVIGLASLLLASFIFWQSLQKGFDWMRLSALTLLVFSWVMNGGHFSLIFICLAILSFLLQGTYKKTWRHFCVGLLLVVVTIIFSTLAVGGIFAFKAPESGIPGVKSVADQADKPAIELRWFRTVEAEFYAPMKMVYLWKEVSNTPIEQTQQETVSPLNQNKPIIYDPALTMDAVTEPTKYTELLRFIKDLKENEILWKFVRLVRSVQLVILPLLGFALGFWLLRKKIFVLPNQFKNVYAIALSLFMSGWVISSIIFVYGQYGELSRFFAPGVSLSLFLLGVVLAVKSEQGNKLQRIAAKTIVFIAVLPVLIDFFIVGILGNFVLPSIDFMRYDSLGVGVPTEEADVLSIQERFDLLLGPSTTRSGM